MLNWDAGLRYGSDLRLEASEALGEALVVGLNRQLLQRVPVRRSRVAQSAPSAGHSNRMSEDTTLEKGSSSDFFCA